MIESAKYNAKGSIIAVIDGVQHTIPNNPNNRHRQMIAEWEAQGNVIQPYAPTIDDYQRAVKLHIDDTARSRGYDNALSIASYANSTNPTWAAEATTFIAWRDSVLTYALAEMTKFQSGERAGVTVEDFVAELPVIQW